MKIEISPAPDSISLNNIEGPFWGKVIPNTCPNRNWDNNIVYFRPYSNLFLLIDSDDPDEEEQGCGISVMDLDDFDHTFLTKTKVIPLPEGSKITITV